MQKKAASFTEMPSTISYSKSKVKYFANYLQWIILVSNTNIAISVKNTW